MTTYDDGNTYGTKDVSDKGKGEKKETKIRVIKIRSRSGLNI